MKKDPYHHIGRIFIDMVAMCPVYDSAVDCIEHGIEFNQMKQQKLNDILFLSQKIIASFLQYFSTQFSQQIKRIIGCLSEPLIIQRTRSAIEFSVLGECLLMNV